MFVERGAVEPGQAMRVGREMARHPVEDEADALGMGGVHEIAEFVRGAEADGGGEDAHGLIAP